MAVLTPQPKMQFTTAAGVPLSGGKVYTYIAGTTTPQATYTDYTGANANTNPVILDSRGEANIWLGGALYKFKLTDANDIEIWTVDYISAPTSAVSPVLSGNVTIDSSTPTPALTITQTGTGPALRVQDAADPDATPFIVDASGNVGIGTAAPAQKLDVYDGVIRVGGSVQGRLLGYSATNSNVLNLGVSVGTGSSTDVGFYNIVSGNAVFGTNNTERMRIDTNGNVGIGEDVPTSLLHLSSPTSATLQVLGDSTTSALLGRASTNATAPQITFAKSRGTQATPTTVASSDNMGTTTYTAYDGTAFRTAAQITGVVETYTTTDNVSGFLSFLTRPTGVAAAPIERMRITADGNLQFNSGYGSVATAYGCRAWVNFNGTGTVAIRASGNVSSITDFGAGSYDVNFSTNMPDTNFTFVGLARNNDNIGPGLVVSPNLAAAKTVSLFGINVWDDVTLIDVTEINIVVFR